MDLNEFLKNQDDLSYNMQRYREKQALQNQNIHGNIESDGSYLDNTGRINLPY